MNDDENRSEKKGLVQDKVLLVDDNSDNLRLLRECLQGLDCEILVAKSGESALAITRKAFPDLILLDIMMPGMDGYEVCRRLKGDEATRHVPILFLTALASAEDEAKGLALGALDYITKPIHPDLVRARVGNHLELQRHQNQLEEIIRLRTRELQLTQAVLIESLATLAEYRDPETGGHIKRTQNYVKALARHLKNHSRFSRELDDATIDWFYMSAPLHDIGKVGVRDEVLLKPGRLTDDEFEQMKKHACYGEEALRITEQKLGKSTFLSYARQIALTHHEKWDGSGYPNGLKGDEIPISGRLMAVADVYDALISRRVYKPPLPHETAVGIIVGGKGTHFDPDVVDAFVALESMFRNIARSFADHDEERQMLDQTPTDGVPNGAGRVKSVLLVEDNEISKEVMCRQLKSSGYVVDLAANGQEALQKYLSNAYDLILTDIEMPEMDGYELTKEIRGHEAGHGRVTPILALTGSDFELSENMASDRGFDGLMLKPLDVGLLQQKLSDVFNRTR